MHNFMNALSFLNLKVLLAITMDQKMNPLHPDPPPWLVTCDEDRGSGEKRLFQAVLWTLVPSIVKSI
jgi:hypothetical protein